MANKFYDNNLIAKAMKARGMSLVQLAAIANIKTVDTIRAVIAGENVRISTLNQVCAALDLKVKITLR